MVQGTLSRCPCPQVLRQYTSSSSALQQHQHDPSLHLAQCSCFQLLPTMLLLGAASLPPTAALVGWGSSSLPSISGRGLGTAKQGGHTAGTWINLPEKQLWPQPSCRETQGGRKSYCCSHTPAITSQQKAASAEPGESLRTGTALMTFRGRAADRPKP